MALQQSDIDALKSAIATGATRVRYPDGREIQYRTLDEMQRILRMAQEDIAASSSAGRPASRTSVAGF
ncbi:hypothetical protein M2336_002802 [Sphingobium sp. B1D7B]|uniref:phage head-tail joining protein n=1 Tax=Sphingobium sp. B1D7B TaxID=2940578 RepID=UPI002224C71D|nr:hypothetical protein [Sphingobium sp. B1D7B]MCW2406173.1 hypothetical protein [Sphingobium sp. B1D7B]